MPASPRTGKYAENVMAFRWSSGFRFRVAVRMASGCGGSSEVARVGAGSTVRRGLGSSGRGADRSARCWCRWSEGQSVEDGQGLQRERGERGGDGQVQQPAAAGAGRGGPESSRDLRKIPIPSDEPVRQDGRCSGTTPPPGPATANRRSSTAGTSYEGRRPGLGRETDDAPALALPQSHDPLRRRIGLGRAGVRPAGAAE
jgi:hypothetical protein